MKAEIQLLEELKKVANLTLKQEQELQAKKAELARLEAQINSEKKPFNWTPWIIGGGIIVVLLGVIIYLLTRNKNKKNYDGMN